jgi:hypothetical protein
MARDLLAGRLGVDAVAFVSMSAALLLGEPLAGAVVAVMYAGGNLLEDFAVARAERDLKSLVDRAPRVAHRRIDTLIEDVAVDQVAIGDTILVRAGSHHPLSREFLQAIAEAIRQGVDDALRAARPAFTQSEAQLPEFFTIAETMAVLPASRFRLYRLFKQKNSGGSGLACADARPSRKQPWPPAG